MSADADRSRAAVEAVWRAESARIVAALTRHTGDFPWAEDLAQEALLEALAAWPASGPAPALDLVGPLEPELAGFRPFHGVRAELLERLGRTDAAAAAFLIAAELPGNAAEAEVLRRRAGSLRAATRAQSEP